MSRVVTAAALAAALFGFGLAKAQADDLKKDSPDGKFIMEAASGGMLEVQLGKLASERAASPDVRKFGERMVTDHTKANKELEAVAEKKGIKLPNDLDKKHQEVYDMLAKLKGAEFDRAYMKHMVKDHEEDVSEFMKITKDAKDGDVKSFATKTLPVIEEHLKMAKDINNKLGGGKDK
jgi:putative membrane protein